MTEEEFKTGKKSKKSGEFIALRDFHIFLPPTFDITIKEGDDVRKLDLPPQLYDNLITEKVLKG